MHLLHRNSDEPDESKAGDGKDVFLLGYEGAITPLRRLSAKSGILQAHLIHTHAMPTWASTHQSCLSRWK